MHTFLLIAALIGTPPTPSGSGDRTVAIYFSPSTPPPAAAAYALAGSAASTITIASWQLTDGTLADSLCLAASRSVSVHVALDLSGGTGTRQWELARQIKASGGSVWNCPLPHKIANNFFSADGTYTLQGNYYYSPTAVQEGSYLTAISGTNAPAANAATFASLISGGTLTSMEVKRDFQLCSLPQTGCTACAGQPAWIPPPPQAIVPDACSTVAPQTASDFPDRSLREERLFLLSLIELSGRPRRPLFYRPPAAEYSRPPDACSAADHYSRRCAPLVIRSLRSLGRRKDR